MRKVVDKKIDGCYNSPYNNRGDASVNCLRADTGSGGHGCKEYED